MIIVSFFSTAKVDTIWLGSFFSPKTTLLPETSINTSFWNWVQACKACWVQRLQLRVPPVHQNLDSSCCFCLFSRWRSYLLFRELLLYYIYFITMFCDVLFIICILTYIHYIYICMLSCKEEVHKIKLTPAWRLTPRSYTVSVLELHCCLEL